jgi:hypothetical protein
MVSLRDDFNIKKGLPQKAEVLFTFTFSKKILHRRSLLHTSSDVLHRFAKQIYFIGGWAYPYAQPPKAGGLWKIP